MSMRVKTEVHEKYCPECETIKNSDCFGYNRDNIDGRHGKCKECRNNLAKDGWPTVPCRKCGGEKEIVDGRRLNVYCLKCSESCVGCGSPDKHDESNYCYPCIQKKNKDHQDSPEYQKVARLRRIRQKFGVSAKEAERLLSIDNCESCGENVKLRKRDHNIDHCHKTGEVRGVLCTKCNAAIGFCKDDINLLWQLIEYLDKRSPKLVKVG